MAVVLNLSFHILMQHPPFKEAVQKEDKESFEKILYECGVDVEAGYEIVVCEHRPYTDKPFAVTCPMVQGVERQDSEWLNNPLCSWEVKKEVIRDPHLRAELKHMSREGSSERAFTNEQAAKAAIRREKKGVN